ncbi:MAG TPA: glycosyltransferase family 39 protein [Thermoanaerobaculia bacterium]|nr:glycosyltransferase family 39 protein [Thermoanaerobaculia bacterium]
MALAVKGHSRWAHLGLASLLVASFALRLASSGAGLDSTRNFDERFTLHNVRAFLEGRFVPANGFYPGLSFLPQTLVLAASREVHRATGWQRAAVFLEDDQTFSPTAYLLARLLSVIYGTLSIWLVYRLGRRLFDPAVGLLAGLLLSAMPAHLAASVAIKPDILVVLLVLVAFDLTVTAVEAPTLGRYARAGAAVGLAVAAKYTGVGAAIPLTLATLWPRPLERRPWGRLVLAGAAAVGAFLVVNPFLPVLLRTLPELTGIYAKKGAEAGGSHLAVLALELRFLVRHHGVALTAVALASLAALAWRVRRHADPRERGRAGLLLAFPIGYSLFYAGATTLFKGQNYLAVGAFTSLAAAWGLVTVARRFVVPRLGRWGAPVLASAGAVLAVLVLKPGLGLVYAELVPTTHERVAEKLLAAFQPLEAHLLVYERRNKDDEPLRVTAGAFKAGTLLTPSLAEVPATSLDRSDAEVFLAERLAEPFYRQRWERTPEAGRLRFGPRWFAARGPELVVLFHPWRQVAEGGELASFTVELPLPAEGGRTVEVAGRLVPLHLTQDRGRKGLFLSERFEVPADETPELRFPEAPEPVGAPVVTWYRWEKP